MRQIARVQSQASGHVAEIIWVRLRPLYRAERACLTAKCLKEVHVSPHDQHADVISPVEPNFPVLNGFRMIRVYTA